MLKWTLPDGTYADSQVLITSRGFRFFSGITDGLAVQVRPYPGSAFQNAMLLGGVWTFPDPSHYPGGLEIPNGTLTIEARAVNADGSLTTAGPCVITREIEDTLNEPPTGTTLERYPDRVEIRIPGTDNENIIGYNVFGSIGSGWKQLNLEPVTEWRDVVEDTPIGTITYTARVPSGTRRDLRLLGQVIEGDSNVESTAFDDIVDLPYGWQNYNVTTAISGQRHTKQYHFTHVRGARPNDEKYPAVPFAEFSSLTDDEFISYRVSAITYINGRETESAFGSVMLGAPFSSKYTPRDIPAVSRQQILKDLTVSIHRSHPDVDVKPGSFLRDVVLDPITLEAERTRFVQNWVALSQSFAGLLSIDDPSGANTSTPVQQSNYKLALKQALFLKDNESTQNTIDNAFDLLAASRGVTRKVGTRSRGEVFFYVTTKPTTTITIPLGTQVNGGDVTFRTTTSATITPYGYTNGRWGATAQVQCATPGSVGNLAANQITSYPGGRVSVTNPVATYGGADTETNRELSDRADRLFSTVDSGTFNGVTKIATVPGVREVKVIPPGDTRHFGTPGTVDVWLRGGSDTPQTDTFAYQSDIVQFGEAQPIGNVANLRFRVIDAGVSETNPIQDLINNPEWGWGFTAHTLDGVKIWLDLTDAQVVAPDGIILSQVRNAGVTLRQTDLFRVSYRFHQGLSVPFTHTPVSAVQAVYLGDTEVTSGISLTSDLDPFTTSSATRLVISNPGTPVSVVDEIHTLSANPEYLLKLGVNPFTIKVTDPSRAITYNSPYSLLTPDYTLVQGTPTSPVAVLPSGRLKSGDRVLISYQHAQNYTVEYTSNGVVSQVQTELDRRKHLTATFRVRETQPIPVDITAVVTLHSGAVASTVQSLIKAEIATLFSTLTLGTPLRQSDIVGAIEKIQGVDYVSLPLTAFAPAPAAKILGEALTPEWRAYPAWDGPLHRAFRTVTGVAFTPATVLSVYADKASWAVVGAPTTSGWPLVGQSGVSLMPDGHLIVSIPKDSDPPLSVVVSYTTATADRVADVRPGPLNYLVPGTWEFVTV